MSHHKKSIKLLQPGVRLMRNLDLSWKLIGLAALMLVPLALVLVQWVVRVQDQRAFTAREVEGAEAVRAAVQMMQLVQAQRAHFNALQAGDREASTRLQAEGAQLLKGLARMDSLMDRDALAAAKPDWTAIKPQVQQAAQGQPPSAEQAFAWFSDLAHRFRFLALRQAEASGLLLDPEAASYLLMDLGTERLPALAEMVGQARGRGLALLKGGEPDARRHLAVAERAAVLQAHLEEIEARLKALERAGEATPAAVKSAMEACAAFAKVVAQFSGEHLPDSTVYFNTGTRALEAVTQAQALVTDRLEELLHKRLRDDARALWWTLAGVLMACLGMLYLLVAFYSSFMGALRVLQRSILHSSQGDLTDQREIRGRDELASMGAAIETLAANLSDMVAHIRSSAALVGEAGAGLSVGTRDLSDRTEQQAASLEQTSATLKEVNQGVAAAEHRAQAADALALKVQDGASDGREGMREAVTRVSQIEQSSRQIGEIITVIDGIAFQTNILALNAAVEAARAGEHGRGFAVVASEVRTLAQRSAQSAAEVRRLVAVSAEDVGRGVQAIRSVSANFDGIVQAIGELTQQVQAIAVAAREQRVSLEQVGQAVEHLDGITQHNASLVEQQAHAAGELHERAEQLASAVASIRLRQGTADEAKRLALSAADHWRAVGHAPALRSFHDKAGGYIDRDMYVFVINRNERFEIFGARPELANRHVSDAPGLDWQPLLRDAFQIPEGASGWVSYATANPLTGARQAKESYVIRLDSERVLGVGVYKPGSMGMGTQAAPAVPSSGRPTAPLPPSGAAYAGGD